MIEFVAFWIDNFAGYRNTLIEFSTDGSRPLTLIRGENQSGKTTLLRALTWVVYGMNAMPKTREGTHPVRPDFVGDGEAVHSGHLIFAHQGQRGRTLFRLRREVVTKATGAQVAVLSEREVLDRRKDNDWRADGGWEDDSGQLETLRRGYFKPELREIIFADADKAEEFVGGPEQNHSNEVMERSVTEALNRLLGIEVIEETIGRVEKARKHFRKKLDEADAKTSGLAELRDEVELLESQIDQTLGELKDKFALVERAKEGLAEVQLEKDKFFADAERTSEIQAEVAEMRAEAEKHRGEAERDLDGIVGRFHDPALPAVLMNSALCRASERLGGLKEEGVLPPGEVSVVPRLLREGRCLCGADCSEGTATRRALESVLEQSQQSAEGRTTLDEVRLQVRALVGRAQALGESWREGLDERVVACAAAQAEASRLEGLIAERQREMANRSEGSGRFQELEDRQARLESDKSSLMANISQQEVRLGARYGYSDDERRLFRLETEEEHQEFGREPLGEEVRKNGLLYALDSKTRHIKAREKAESRAELEQTQLRLTQDVKQTLGYVRASIREEQIPEVSRRMNEMYRDVMQAGEESPTAEVGIRETTHGYAGRDYELFAKNRQGHNRDLGLLSGGERRAVSTAFLLALVSESGAKVPFVSDSLLQSLGGTVRTNLIRRVVASAPQSIMFALRTDVARGEDRNVLAAAAGATYTVTNQAHVPEKVVRKTESQSGSQCVLCTCGPASYCDICERVEDEEDEDLARSQDSYLVN